ncbi:hypothetical protein COCON_G00193170 [Conger conger]|uniref:DUF5641 domain-containing protein n=1 Tax=Conger conger TaxID=82655 RepID=A0A9Q1HSB5_CONCO|nr:hypothetical protein COCON_G00193170 [Conger conger]
MRRELVSSGLLKFEDKPENYWAWKASFISSTDDLKLSAREELDLLCKWLGPSSSEQAKRIRAVHIQNPPAGLRMLWQRLEDFYGSVEVENALLKKVEDFPKISAKENHKLRELGDILMELEAARADGYLPGLSYLSTSHGVSPIVQKLPSTSRQKVDPVLPPTGEYDLKDLYSKQWKQVQALADAFWKRWRQEYLVSLQPRRKWHMDKPNLSEGDVVLLSDAQVKRNEWPVGVVVNAIPSKVRKVDCLLIFELQPSTFLTEHSRPWQNSTEHDTSIQCLTSPELSLMSPPGLAHLPNLLLPPNSSTAARSTPYAVF